MTDAVAGVGILASVTRTKMTSPRTTRHTMSLEEIVDLLDRHGRRATYGAVASVLGHSPARCSAAASVAGSTHG